MRINSRPVLIENGRLFDPSTKIDRTGSILLSKGKITWIGKSGENPLLPDFESFDATGMTVCAGFIDMHCHLRQPGYEYKETIYSGTRAAAKGGFTTVCCMPNTKPPTDSKQTVENIRSIASLEGVIRVLPVGCISVSRQGKNPIDMRALANAGAIAFSDDGSPVMDDKVMEAALRYSIKTGLTVIDHCENTSLADGWDMNGGKLADELGLRGMPDRSEESMIERDVELNRKIGGKLHIAHISTAESVEIIRKAKVDGIRITAEVTPTHLTLTEKAAAGKMTNAKVNPPLRKQKDVNALVKGINDGTIDIIATDHAPHSTEDKNCDFAKAAFGISSFETAFGSLMELVHKNKISMDTLIIKLTAAPAAIIGSMYGAIGSMAVGNSADITIFDPDRKWIVDTSKFLSKGRNTPLDGEQMKGKVIATFYQGNLVFIDDSVKTAMKG
jgi:dihydroorotase